MPQLTSYQYVKLGSNLEFVRGISSASVMETASLASFPGLLENQPNRRPPVANAANVVRSLLVQLQEMGLQESLRAAELLRPMLKEMDDYHSNLKPPQYAFLNNPFAERLIALAKQLCSAVRIELGMASTIQARSASERDLQAMREE